MHYSNKQQRFESQTSIIGNSGDLDIGIDKISVTVPIAREDHSQFRKAFETKSVKELQLTAIEWVPGRSRHYEKNYKIMIKDHLGYGEGTMLIQLAPKFPQNAFMRLEFNPEKFVHDRVVSEIDVLMMEALGMGFDDLLGMGKVTRIDFYADVSNVNMNQFLFDAKYKSKVGVWSKRGVIETAYLGQLGRGGFRIYQKDKQDRSFPKDTVRFEAVVKPKDLSVTNLDQVANPFTTLKIYTLSVPANWSVNRSLAFKWLVSHSRDVGLKSALKSVPKPKMKFYKKRLQRNQYNLFPDIHWKLALRKALVDTYLFRIRRPPVAKRHMRGY